MLSDTQKTARLGKQECPGLGGTLNRGLGESNI